VQLYDFNPTGTVVVQYNRGGGAQSVTLNYDEVPSQYAVLELDRTSYPNNAMVHFTISDPWLDIDPTDEDSWTWDVEGANAGAAYYQAFDENGARQGATPDVSGSLGSLMCDNNCTLELDRNAQGGANVVGYAENDDSDTRLSFASASDRVAPGTVDTDAEGLVTVTETESTSGVFASYDNSDRSVLRTLGSPPRDTTATINYNRTPQSIAISYAFATIDIQPSGDAWLSGQEIPVVLTDADANRNSRVDEDLDALNSDHIIPALVTGSPATITNARYVAFDSGIPGDLTGTGAPGDDVTYTGDVILSASGVGSGPSRAAVDTYDAPALRSTIAGTLSQAGRAFVIDYGGPAGLAPSATSTAVINFDFSQVPFESGVAAADRDFDVWALVRASGGLVIAGNTDADLYGKTYLLERDTVRGTYVLPPAVHVTAPTGFGLMVMANGNVPGDFPAVTAFADVMTFGFTDDGVDAGERIANQVIRLELEETADNTGVFEGTLEYSMVNQLNIAEDSTYGSLAIIDDEGTLIAIEDLTDEDTLRVSYADLGGDGVVTPVTDDEAAPSHSGTVSFDATSYKIADTVTVTLRDADLNTSSDTTEVYTIPRRPGAPPGYAATTEGAVTDAQRTAAASYNSGNAAHVGRIGGIYDQAYGSGSGPFGRVLDVTIDDVQWKEGQTLVVSSGGVDRLTTCLTVSDDNGLRETGFTLRETSAASGVFEGDFQIPSDWCRPGSPTPETVTGKDIEVNYVDFRDASGETIEVGDSAGIRANTGSVSLDRPVYPVPFGSTPAGADAGSSDYSRFETYELRDHDNNANTDGVPVYLPAHPTMVHVRVTDPDFDQSASGEDTLAMDVNGVSGRPDGYGPLRVSVMRGSDEVVLAYAGGAQEQAGGDRAVRPLDSVTAGNAIDAGPLTETSPSSGTFELDLSVAWNEGPASSRCPAHDRVLETAPDTDPNTVPRTCILQGDILLAEYTDPADASGSVQTVTDSATFDMRNGVLRSDKSVYIIGSDMILTLIEPDLDLDNDTAETYTLHLVEWDDDDSTVTLNESEFDPEPNALRETGDSTGIFQVVVEIPSEINGDDLERGEEVELEYKDWSPAGANHVGQTDEEIAWSIYTSDFGATIELDQAVYTWTDKVFITVVAPDHNFDSNLIDRIGDTREDPLQVSTRLGGTLDNYVLTETGTDTGIFSGEVILRGFTHDADGDDETGPDGNDRTTLQEASGRGPTDGIIAASDDDGITVSYEYNDDEHVLGSALIRWNVGDTQWLEASYPASGSGVVRVVDPDMNLNPEAVDNFAVTVYSDADAGGINLTVTETQEATGIFEGTVVFTLTDQSSGHRLRVAEGDTVTARYDDNTLPDPYTRNDELEVEGTTIIGTLVPPLERAVVSNVRLTDNSGNPLDTVAVGQQVQVTGQVASGQETEQAYAYLVQINDSSDVTLSLTWTSGTLNAGQTLSPSMSWQPTEAGEYTATVFVWESIDNPTALSPQQELSFTVG